jgi:hypothetical protein
MRKEPARYKPKEIVRHKPLVDTILETLSGEYPGERFAAKTHDYFWAHEGGPAEVGQIYRPTIQIVKTGFRRSTRNILGAKTIVTLLGDCYWTTGEVSKTQARDTNGEPKYFRGYLINNASYYSNRLASILGFRGIPLETIPLQNDL